MSQPQFDESDPLLGFEMETTAPAPPTVPAEPAAQPAVEREDPSLPSLPAIDVQSVVERVDRIERGLEQSNQEAASLRSEVATLVGATANLRNAIEEMKKQMSRGPEPVLYSGPPARVAWPRAASAAAAAIIGLSVAVFGWFYWANTNATTAAPAIEQASISPATTTPATTTPTPVSAPGPAKPSPQTAPVAPAPARAQNIAPERSEIAAPEPIRYVGTLSIDAAPGGAVFVDRKAAGRTPLRMTNLRAGSHLIWVERDGYHRWTRVVQVPANRVSRVSAELEPIASR